MTVVKTRRGLCPATSAAVAADPIVEGELVAATYNGKSGKEAFFKLLNKTDGRFRFQRALSENEKTAPVLGTFMEMLLEGLRRMDEERNGQEQTAQVLV